MKAGVELGIFDFLPMFPWEGPPLPRFLGVYWLGTFSKQQKFPSLKPFVGSSHSSEGLSTTYENIEEIELVDIDPDLLMPRKIVVHRKARAR